MKRSIPIITVGFLVFTFLLTGCDVNNEAKLQKEKENAYSQKENAYSQAVVKFDEAMNKREESYAGKDFKEAVELFEQAGDYSDAEQRAQEAKNYFDSEELSSIHGGWLYSHSGQTLIEEAGELYNKENAEKLVQWVNLNQEIMSYYRYLVNDIKETLKSPSSFEDAGSTYGYSVKKSGDNAYVIQDLTFLMDYTATNSFGGRVRKQEERSFKDIDYTTEFKYVELTEDVLLEVLNTAGVDEVFDKIEEYYQSVLGENE